MVELGVKKIITNPKLLESEEIIKVVDSRSGRLKAFVVPAKYAKIVEDMEKELVFRRWVEEKKRLKAKSENLDECSDISRELVGEYLEKG